MAPFSFYFCPFQPSTNPSLLLLPFRSSSFYRAFSLSLSRHSVSTKKLTNRPRERDAQVRLFIKKFLLRSAQQSIRRRRLGLRSKNLFALPPPPSPPPSLPFGRYCFTILYYTAWYVEFRLFGFNETRPRIARRLTSPRFASPRLAASSPRLSSYLASHRSYTRRAPVHLGPLGITANYAWRDVGGYTHGVGIRFFR